MAKLDELGREVLDPTPVAIPVGFQKPESLAETIRRLVRTEEFRRAVERQGMETFEEADDFEVGEDYDPSSPYETQFDPGLNREVTNAEAELLNAARKEFDRRLPPRQPKTGVAEEEEPVKRSRKSRKASGVAPADAGPEDDEGDAQ